MRILVATHPAPVKKKQKRQVGLRRLGVVSELFVTTLPQSVVTACDVGSLSLHRGAFETAREDEDIEHEPDRWCRDSAWGQEAWQIIAQWTGNLRLDLGPQLVPDSVRTIACAPALSHQDTHVPTSPVPPAPSAPASGSAPPTSATSWKADRFTGADVPLQPDGTLQCPAGCALVPHERQREQDGRLRVVSAASMRDGRPCPLREPCHWNGSDTRTPRQVSLLLHPLPGGSAPLLWRDGHRRHQRRACLRLHRQHLQIQMEPVLKRTAVSSSPTISRAERAHSRLSWDERLARHA